MGAPLLAVLLVGLTACETPPARWLDSAGVVTVMPSPLQYPAFVPYDSTLADSTAEAAFLLTQDQLREAGAVTLLAAAIDSLPESQALLSAASAMPPMQMAPAPTTSLGDGDVPLDAARCARSLRFASAPGRGKVAVWWTRVNGGRVHLAAAWRDTVAAERRLGAWRGPIMVDTLDQGPRDAQASERGAYGCARPAPSLAVDSLNGYVHVAYHLVGKEGAGLFFTHSMERGALWHEPVPIVYGDQPSFATVASRGDTVVVAYEDPNSKVPRLGLAVSRTQGHIFEGRQPASDDTGEARGPRIAVHGDRVTIAWTATQRGGTRPRTVVRQGTLAW